MAMPFYECRRCKNVHLLLLLFFISSVGIFPRDLRKKLKKLTNGYDTQSVQSIIIIIIIIVVVVVVAAAAQTAF